MGPRTRLCGFADEGKPKDQRSPLRSRLPTCFSLEKTSVYWVTEIKTS